MLPAFQYKKYNFFLQEIGQNTFRFKDEKIANRLLFDDDFERASIVSIESINMQGPTLLFNDKLITMKEIQPNLFEPNSMNVFYEVLKETALPNIGFDYHSPKKHLPIPRVNRDGVGKLAIIVPFFNYNINPRMVENYNRFRQALGTDDVFVIESTLNVDYQIPESKNFIRIEAKPENLMWQKERMLNLAIKKLPGEYTDVAWIDADVLFDDLNWIEEATEKLKDYAFVQLFNTAQWLDDDGSVIHKFRSPFSQLRDGSLRHHVGFAWAARREVIEQSGGLFDYHVTGNGDCFIYHALTGVSENEMGNLSMEIIKGLPGFQYVFWKYRNKMQEITKSSVTCLSGNIRHLYHGNLASRKYSGRQMILIKNKFDPLEDLRVDDNGLYRWDENERTAKIREMISSYFSETAKQ